MAAYSGYYFGSLIVFAIWLWAFGDQLSESALISLMACVLGGFSILGYRGGASRKESAWHPAIKVAIAVAAMIILDTVLPSPREYELLLQSVLIAFLWLSLRRNGV